MLSEVSQRITCLMISLICGFKKHMVEQTKNRNRFINTENWLGSGKIGDTGEGH